MDLLSDVLRVARLSGGVFLRANFSAPWCVSSKMAPENCAPFLPPAKHLLEYHFIVEGTLQACIRGRPETAVTLKANEVVIVPHNDEHLLGSDLSLPVIDSATLAVPTENGMFTLNHGGGGERVRMICGYLGCESGEGNPVLANLPPILRLAIDEGESDWIRSTFTFAAQECPFWQIVSPSPPSMCSEAEKR